ncbi:hypothetical protein EA58_20195 [Photobacterium galatheae]|uniref:Uncharacterized protein n=1 Tax=Photobacterium galatheae TaxID=1654360 RepID=A0A066RH65_9GAMM|nr:hypothetical protein EA58_20195 [Photobacterium galatheae]
MMMKVNGEGAVPLFLVTVSISRVVSSPKKILLIFIFEFPYMLARKFQRSIIRSRCHQKFMIEKAMKLREAWICSGQKKRGPQVWATG